MNVLISEKYRWQRIEEQGTQVFYIGSGNAVRSLTTFLKEKPES